MSFVSPVAAPMTGPSSDGFSPSGIVSWAMLAPSDALTLELMIELTTAVPTHPPSARMESTIAVLVAISEDGAYGQ